MRDARVDPFIVCMAVRYALGRKTGAPDAALVAVQRNVDTFDPGTRVAIVRDIERADADGLLWSRRQEWLDVAERLRTWGQADG